MLLNVHRGETDWRAINLGQSDAILGDLTDTRGPKLQALVYDILPATTARVDYAIGLEKLSANEQLFDDAQTAVSL